MARRQQRYLTWTKLILTPIVPIQARVRDLDSEPALGHLRFREIADGESGQRIVRDCLGGVNGKHCQVLSLSSFDKQRGNLVALECEVVAELDRTSWKAAADVSGDNRLVTNFGDVGDLGVRLVFSFTSSLHSLIAAPRCSRFSSVTSASSAKAATTASVLWALAAWK